MANQNSHLYKEGTRTCGDAISHISVQRFKGNRTQHGAIIYSTSSIIRASVKSLLSFPDGMD